MQEVRATAQLQNPHILPLFDSGEADGFLYYVMPYIEGETLRDRVARDAAIAIPDACTILREILDGLGRRGEAAALLDQFLRLWADADEEFVPVVADARERAARLGPSGS